MIYTRQIQRAINFAIQIHEVDQKQKRKGKDVPYIVHPLIVGVILAKCGSDEDVVAAGILHDTIEDSALDHRVSKEMLKKEFGKKVADIVDFVSEEPKEVPWEIRKRNAHERIKEYSLDALLVKSADVIENLSELIDDYEKDGERVFDRFSAPKEKFIKNFLQTVTAVISRWPENIFAEDLRRVAGKLQLIGEKQEII